jgi:FMN phosphatase YigB (HAD superfamily)
MRKNDPTTQRAKFDLSELSQIIIIKGEIGYCKPGKRIYDILLDEVQPPLLRCAFVNNSSKPLFYT